MCSQISITKQSMWSVILADIVVSLKFNQFCAFKDIIILARMTCYMDHLVKEATEIYLSTSNFNRDTGFHLSCYYPAMNIIKHMRELMKPLEEGPGKTIVNLDEQPAVLHVIKR